MVNYHSAKAKRLEKDAFFMEKSKQNKREKSKRLSDTYRKAGEEYERIGFLQKAYANYKDALKFALEKDRNEIAKKMDKAEEGSKRILKSSLERKFIFAFLSIASFIVALFFISFNFTGYVVLGQGKNNLGFFAVGCFILGLVCVFFYFKNEK
jgi:hypothetical protein